MTQTTKSTLPEALGKLRAELGLARDGERDTVEIVRQRMADGRTIADIDVHRLVGEIERLRAEVADLKCSVIAFCAPAAVHYAEQFGLPDRHLHPTHYDILARADANLEAFTRADVKDAD